MVARKYRIAALLAALAGVSWLALTDYTRPPPDWDETLRIVIYPHNADGSESAAHHITQQAAEDFRPIAEFFAEQATHYDLALEHPFELAMGPPLDSAPVSPPRPGTLAQRLRWGLSVHWWKLHFRDHDNDPDIIVIVHHYDPDNRVSMPCPVAIEEYRLVIANMVARDTDCQGGLVVIAHEILHTVGASDLHDPHTLIPRHPEGFAEPGREPLYPQTRAELMAPRIPISPYSEHEARNFDEVTIGGTTAREIHWIRPD